MKKPVKRSIRNLDNAYDKRSKRDLSAQDKSLWQSVTDSVDPLKDRPIPTPDMKTPAPKAQVKNPEVRHLEGADFLVSEPRAQTAISRKQTRRIHKGQVDIDSVIDLHGLTQAQARKKLDFAIPQARARGEYCVLVITGKGGVKFAQTDAVPVAQRKYEEFSPTGGVLQQAVPDWLRGPELSPHVASFQKSHQNHGGRGALYVILRKANFNPKNNPKSNKGNI
jgi:DNA-nicking Smr family endonuclease